MNWKDLMIGAIVTLIITIIAGLLVYYITREPIKQKTEKLVYVIEPIANFETDVTQLAILNIRIWNSGDASAKDVRVAIDVPQPTHMKDRNISISTDKVSGLQIELANDTQLKFFVPSLIPNEKIQVSLLLSSKPYGDPIVLVKCETSLGKPDISEPEKKPERSSIYTDVLPWFISLLTALLLPLVLLYYRSRLKSTQYPSSKNNNAFALLHQGLHKKAQKILMVAIEKGEGSPETLSNMAVCLALAEDYAEANKYLLAAEQFGLVSKLSKALHLFNKSLVLFIEKDFDSAFNFLKEAIESNPDYIKSFCQSSGIVKDICRDNPKIRELF